MKIALIIFAVVLLGTVILNVLIVIFSGTNVAVPDIPREAITVGSGEKINYLILGDSTTVAQGAEYENGYVVQTAEALGETYEVTYKNAGISGATIGDVVENQLSATNDFKPDIVLVAVGANDVTHLTKLSNIEKSIITITEKLRASNPDVKIVFTGSAAMGTVHRFPQPMRWLAGVRTSQINDVFVRVTNEQNVIFADIAGKTREKFKNSPELLAQDNFHPNADGYAEWTKALTPVLRDALSR